MGRKSDCKFVMYLSKILNMSYSKCQKGLHVATE